MEAVPLQTLKLRMLSASHFCPIRKEISLSFMPFFRYSATSPTILLQRAHLKELVLSAGECATPSANANFQKAYVILRTRNLLYYNCLLKVAEIFRVPIRYRNANNWDMFINGILFCPKTGESLGIVNILQTVLKPYKLCDETIWHFCLQILQTSQKVSIAVYG